MVINILKGAPILSRELYFCGLFGVRFYISHSTLRQTSHVRWGDVHNAHVLDTIMYTTMPDLPPESNAPAYEFPKGSSMAPETDGPNTESATNTTEANGVFTDLQNLFTPNGEKNLVIYVGHPQVVIHFKTSKFNILTMEWKIMSTSPFDFNLGMPFNMGGFPNGYFRIRAAGTKHYWALHGGDSSKDGNVICLYEYGDRNHARRFFMNSRGELCTDSTHIDVMDNTLIASHERPPTFPWPNPWSHKLATFCYSQETRMISVKLYADPFISNQWPRLDQEWKDKEYVIAARPPTATRTRRADEISRWTPKPNPNRWTDRTDSLKANAWDAVGVEEKAEMMKLEDVNRIRWEIEQFQ
ncbi:uncharacterized protein LACBIDRAFT_316324 [Laccaria bicolor S238N-H82]|uniref:Predicted protein n=1 Tax=Laccaria bicolor (strain S238N-H82 / ATCC MYA-4686) TaxID=486041 RepID=B0E0Q1_LACBS|nr:uncharacterized protein LACBIDRAFT_316324 [Laccaria bicolor S238N-H82]EDQ99541.1 predicted protein [Laccaria bicolor S238N-H82]|eukprot:XP_001889765.1 predicted protein [Laccaria bicolor S238N-H82]